MKLLSRSALALALGVSLATALTSCDYRYSPGLDDQRRDFSRAPGWRNEDVNRDSVNYKQRAPEPGGVGSAADIRNGDVDTQLSSAPAGRTSASGQLPSGQMEQAGGNNNKRKGNPPNPK
jgi:hypothetical protein